MDDLRDATSHGLLTAVSAVFFASSATTLGLGTISFLGYGLTDVWTALAGIDITYGSAAALGAVIMGYGLSNRDVSDFTDGQTIMAVLTAAGTVFLGLAPTLRSALASDPWLGGTAFVLLGIGYGTIVGSSFLGEGGQ